VFGERNADVGGVLRITLINSAGGITFKLEGKLAGAWVGELERNWYPAIAGSENQRLTVDLSGLTFVNAEGRELLAWMYRRGAVLKASNYTTRCLVEEIERSTQARVRSQRF
jgi:hypothetical protein